MNGFILLLSAIGGLTGIFCIQIILESLANKLSKPTGNRYKKPRKAINPNRKLNFTDWA